VTAFMLVCYLGATMEFIYFKNINDCLAYKNQLHNQIIKKNDKEQVYQCMCKLVANVDTNKVRVY
jgi:hypothetical protein